jgi:hypothetical protein
MVSEEPPVFSVRGDYDDGLSERGGFTRIFLEMEPNRQRRRDPHII